MVEPTIIYEGPYKGYALIRVVRINTIRFVVEFKRKDALGKPSWVEAGTLTDHLNNPNFCNFVLCKLIAKDCNE